MAKALRRTSRSRCFGGEVCTYIHDAQAVGGLMNLSVYLPPQAAEGSRLPALFCLAGLTCDHTTFFAKSGAQRFAAQHGLVLVAPDTSPRHIRHPGDDESWDFGISAGFYCDATQAPWRDNYRMGSYVADELPALVAAQLPVDPDRLGVLGHSVGGHGALVLGLKHPDRFKSVSAFAPMVAPSSCPWGEKAFDRFLGPDRAAWAEWDATALVEAGRRTAPILVDQGATDQFLAKQLRPQLFADACAAAGQPLRLRMQEGYDHSYFTIATFMEDHIAHHARMLGHAAGANEAEP